MNSFKATTIEVSTRSSDTTTNVRKSVSTRRSMDLMLVLLPLLQATTLLSRKVWRGEGKVNSYSKLQVGSSSYVRITRLLKDEKLWTVSVRHVLEVECSAWSIVTKSSCEAMT